MHTTGIVVFAGLIGVVINQIFSGLYIAGRVHNIKNVYSVGRPLRAVLRPRRAARFQHRVLFLLPRAVRGADSGDGSHPPDRRGHRPHPGGAYFFRHHAGLYVVRRYARRNHDRCSAVCDHYHRRELCGYLAIDHLGGFDA